MHLHSCILPCPGCCSDWTVCSSAEESTAKHLQVHSISCSVVSESGAEQQWVRGVRKVWTWPHGWSGMRCMAEMLGSVENGSPVAVNWTGRVDARRSCLSSIWLRGWSYVCLCSVSRAGDLAATVSEPGLARVSVEVAIPVAVSVMAWRAVLATVQAVSATASKAASRIEAACPRTTLDIEPSIDSYGGRLATAASWASLGVTELEAPALAGNASASEGIELRAEAATEPRRVTASPRRLRADAPAPSNVEDAEFKGSCCGSGGRGNSWLHTFALLRAALLAVESTSAKFGAKRIAFLDEGVSGGEEMDKRLLDWVGGSFGTGATQRRRKRASLERGPTQHANTVIRVAAYVEDQRVAPKHLLIVGSTCSSGADDLGLAALTASTVTPTRATRSDEDG